MKFIREIPIKNLTDQVISLQSQEGWVIIKHEDSWELWYHCQEALAV